MLASESNDATNTQRTTRGIPQFLLSPTIRLVFLRIVIASAIIMFGFTIYDIDDEDGTREAVSIVALVSIVVTVIHNIGTALGPRLFPLPFCVDIPLSVAEIAARVYVASYHARLYSGSRNSFDLNILGYIPKLLLLTYVGSWLLAASLIVLLALKVLHMVSIWHNRVALSKLDIADLPQCPWWKHPLQALFGIALWSPNVPQSLDVNSGEPKWLALVRGALAAISVCALAAFGVYNAVVAPISEIGMIPYRQFRASLAPPSFADVHNQRSWKVVLVHDQRPRATATLASSVTAISHWGTSDQPPSACHVENATLQRQGAYPTWEVSVVTCLQPLHEGERTIEPTFDITVDHTGLVGDTPDWALDSVSVFVGLTDDIEIVFSNTEAIMLFQGTHLLTVVDTVYRQRLKPVALATLGFETSEKFSVASIKQTIPDPRPTTGSDLAMSTLRIAMQDITSGYNIVEDYRSKSVFTGLSFVGGLGSFLSTLLVILLGTSLMGAVIRSKPHSPFGFLHNIRALQTQMVAECEKVYPALRRDIEDLEKNPGVVAYILNTLLDMEPLGYRAQAGRESDSDQGPPNLIRTTRRRR
ncbi:hypothetical protein NMY22_g4036 [Coprinellus aureogranulatus]|nr:hypothetical protein NMY22_g4036 [Coprinellus aureogranulatus]